MGFFSSSKGKAAEAAAAAKGKAVEAAEAAKDKAAVAAEAAKDKASAAAAATSDAVYAAGHSASNTAKECTSNAKECASSAASALNDEAHKLALAMLQRGVEKAMPQLSKHLREQVVDPDMPSAIQQGVGAVVDVVVDEVEDILKEALTEKLLKRGHTQMLAAPPPPCCGPGTGCFGPLIAARAFVRYHVLPADKSFWAKTKDPYFWVFFAVATFPILGLRVFWWTFIFLLLDKSDDYQLCTFVINFKASQFISGGIEAALMSSAIYTACLDADNCHTHAPGSVPVGFEAELVAAFVQAAVCWFAMAFLPFSRPMGYL